MAINNVGGYPYPNMQGGSCGTAISVGAIYPTQVNATPLRNYVTDITEDYIIKQIERDKQTLEDRTKLLEIFKESKFKKSDVIYHKQHGNGLINSVNALINMEGKISIEYSAIFITRDCMNAGAITFQEEDMIPYTEMSKLLYNKE
jgi:hypothetical protein